MQSCDTAFPLRDSEERGQRGREGASLWSSASLRTICLLLAQHSAPLSISTYKYIHSSHPVLQRSHTPSLSYARQEMGSESRLKSGRVVGLMPAISSLTGGRGMVHTIGWIMEWGLWIGCVIRVLLIYTRPANGICLSPAAWYHSKQH